MILCTLKLKKTTTEVILNLFHLSGNSVIEIARMHGGNERVLFAIAIATNILWHKIYVLPGATEEPPSGMLW